MQRRPISGRCNDKTLVAYSGQRTERNPAGRHPPASCGLPPLPDEAGCTEIYTLEDSAVAGKAIVVRCHPHRGGKAEIPSMAGQL